jgi:hypothetical protein
MYLGPIFHVGLLLLPSLASLDTFIYMHVFDLHDESS